MESSGALIRPAHTYVLRAGACVPADARRWQIQLSGERNRTAPGLGFYRLLHRASPRKQTERSALWLIAVRCGLGSVQDVANLLWGYGTLGRTPAPTLLQSIAAEAVLKVEEFKPFELINVLWGFAMVRVHVAPPVQRPATIRVDPPPRVSWLSPASRGVATVPSLSWVLGRCAARA